MPKRTTSVTPSAARLTDSLRDIGYDFSSAIADLVDNSIAAGANNVWLDFTWNGGKALVVLRDDGHGMTLVQLREALRVGKAHGRIYLGMHAAV